MRAALPGQDLFFQQTAHLTPHGHEIVADGLTGSSMRWLRRAASRGSRAWSSTHSISSPSSVVVYALYRLLPHRAQNGLLLVASYYFYAAWDWRFLGLLIVSTLVDYTCARWDRPRRTIPDAARLLLIVSIGFNLRMLGFFKYFNFFAGSLLGTVRRCRMASRFRHAARAAADRHLVLHVHDDELRHRRVSPRDPADAKSRRLRACSSRISRISSPGPILRATRLLPQIAQPRTDHARRRCATACG